MGLHIAWLIQLPRYDFTWVKKLTQVLVPHQSLFGKRLYWVQVVKIALIEHFLQEMFLYLTFTKTLFTTKSLQHTTYNKTQSIMCSN